MKCQKCHSNIDNTTPGYANESDELPGWCYGCELLLEEQASELDMKDYELEKLKEDEFLMAERKRQADEAIAEHFDMISFYNLGY